MTSYGNQMNLQQYSRVLHKIESQFGLYPTAFLLGVMLLGIAAIYVTPALHTINLGAFYEILSLNPFNFQAANPLQLRILTPLLAYLLFLRGSLFLLFPLLVGILFLALIYIHYRKQNFAPIESLGMASLMAFSTPILCTLHFQGYTDTTSDLLLFLCFIFINSPLWFLFFGLAILNHESNLFAAPYLLWFDWQINSHWRGRAKSLILFGLSSAPFFLYRAYVARQTTVLFSPSFYLNMQNIQITAQLVARLLPIGIFEAFKLFWGFPFFAFLYLLRKKNYLQALWIFLVVLCAGLQLLIAHDTSRLIGLAFPCILFGAQVVRDELKSDLFEKKLWTVIGLNFLVPTYYVGLEIMIPFLPLPVSLLLNWLGVDSWRLWWV